MSNNSDKIVGTELHSVLAALKHNIKFLIFDLVLQFLLAPMSNLSTVILLFEILPGTMLTFKETWRCKGCD